MLASRGAGRSTMAGHGLTVRDEVQRPSAEEPFVRHVIVDRTDARLAGGKAGLQPGDVLEHVGDMQIQSSLDLERALLDHAAGDHVPVVYRRDGAEKTTELVLESVASPGADGDIVWRKLGLKLQNTSADGVTRSHPQLHGGLMVVDVRTESTAGKAGIQRGDILVGLHDWEMLSMDNVLYVLNHPKLSTFGPLRYYVLRSGQVYRGVLNAAE
jgi:serine protease Do